ncbi:glycosyltransferase [Pseudonocardia abyssalis]|uniref:Glycosyltransferase n=1 Tax=Pseudonocardia abyssalis TaxID=2792008 RepID=A0ABS6UX28_9PSEU|nr:glycosyltransferase [Pseudonocardia abyssalis]MBW0115846.1 glycosyltransferase [Pseudonocardia abyssalis]MBW0136820.1 glycosyltransferase [Pseudonocardia abyssalis]
MPIAVVALDTRGGVQPYAALALGLQEAGHEVRMVAPAEFTPWLAGMGLDVHAAGAVTAMGAVRP